MKDAGTQMEFLGKDNRVGDSPDSMNYGDFCLISGDNLGFESADREYDGNIETINDKLERMHPGIDLDITVTKDPDVDLLEEESDAIEFEF